MAREPRRRSTRLSDRKNASPASGKASSSVEPSSTTSSSTKTSQHKVTKHTKTQISKHQGKSKPKPRKLKTGTWTLPTSQAAVQDPATHARILGGLNGDYRATGRPKQADAGTGLLSFSIPFKEVGRDVVCEVHGLPLPLPLSSGDGDGREEDVLKAIQDATSTKKPSRPSLIFTHGAGGGIENPATRAFAAGYGGADNAAVAVAFQGTMNLQSRAAAFRAVVDALFPLTSQVDGREKIVLGGRSMGARAAVLCCNQLVQSQSAVEEKLVLVLVSYPLVGGKEGTDVRDGILKDIPAGVDVLFVVGDRDHMCDLKRLQTVCKAMKANTWLAVVEGADHSMSLKRKGGVESARRETGRLAAEWAADRSVDYKYCTVSWDEDEAHVERSEWRRSL